MDADGRKPARYGMAIDLDSCTGCGACVVACAVESNVPPVPCTEGDRKGITWLRVYRAAGADGEGRDEEAFFPVPCQHCDDSPPCQEVCPQNAVQKDPETGIVSQIPVRCLGCRYCMAACPYHARYFNWWDPAWPAGMEGVLNPEVAPRMRGVVEKCNLCHGRLQAARECAAAEGRHEPNPGEYVPACVEACPAGAIVFGDLLDPESEVAKRAGSPEAFRLLERLGTEPKVHYLSKRPWVRRLGAHVFEERGREA